MCLALNDQSWLCVCPIGWGCCLDNRGSLTEKQFSQTACWNICHQKGSQMESRVNRTPFYFIFFGKPFTWFKQLKSKFSACFSQFPLPQEHCLISHCPTSVNEDDCTKAVFVTFMTHLNDKHVYKRDKLVTIVISTSSWLFIATTLQIPDLDWFHQNWTFPPLVVYPGNLRLYVVDSKKWSKNGFWFFL